MVSKIVQELDFTIELNAEGLSDRLESEMFAEADSRLRELAGDHDDLTGAAINIRRPAKTETSFLYEVTVVVYSRLEEIVATTKEADPRLALLHVFQADCVQKPPHLFGLCTRLCESCSDRRVERTRHDLASSDSPDRSW